VPIYIYECLTCEDQFKVSHGMTEEHEKCDSCESGDIRRVPTLFTNLAKKRTIKSRTGDVTKEFIESAREELKQERKELDDKR
jgi:putative FmdB family regulatory protein